MPSATCTAWAFQQLSEFISGRLRRGAVSREWQGKEQTRSVSWFLGALQ